ncbi:hypothetical protein SLW56_20760, partial [Xanthomonas sp. LF07-6]|uniref:hypothetical protein n=1 Tax=Xanthomonas sp. LF07-6 TaxID=3097550 RepID=UPI002A811065
MAILSTSHIAVCAEEAGYSVIRAGTRGNGASADADTDTDADTEGSTTLAATTAAAGGVPILP